MIKSQLERSAALWLTPPLSQVGGESTERTSAFQIFYLVGWTPYGNLMSEPPESELAGVTLESDALPLPFWAHCPRKTSLPVF
jgi:hypothetical protein